MVALQPVVVLERVVAAGAVGDDLADAEAIEDFQILRFQFFEVIGVAGALDRTAAAQGLAGQDDEVYPRLAQQRLVALFHVGQRIVRHAAGIVQCVAAG